MIFFNFLKKSRVDNMKEIEEIETNFEISKWVIKPILSEITNRTKSIDVVKQLLQDTQKLNNLTPEQLDEHIRVHETNTCKDIKPSTILGGIMSPEMAAIDDAENCYVPYEGDDF